MCEVGCVCVFYGMSCDVTCRVESGVFFFQAEDVIRDLGRSRGLGDVYKRQDQSQGQHKHQSLPFIGRQPMTKGESHNEEDHHRELHHTLMALSLIHI